MKKRMTIILTLISIIAMVAGTAAAPLESRSIKLVSTQFIQGKGVVFLFATTGKFTKSDLKTAFAYTGGDSLSMDCKIKDGEDQIVCTAALVNQYVGKSIMVGLIGQGFWTTVPAKPAPAPTCYGLYDFFDMNGDIVPWHLFDTICQDTPAKEGDQIEHLDPSGHYRIYVFLLDGVGGYNAGAAYYASLIDIMP